MLGENYFLGSQESLNRNLEWWQMLL